MIGAPLFGRGHLDGGHEKGAGSTRPVVVIDRCRTYAVFASLPAPSSGSTLWVSCSSSARSRINLLRCQLLKSRFYPQLVHLLYQDADAVTKHLAETFVDLPHVALALRSVKTL